MNHEIYELVLNRIVAVLSEMVIGTVVGEKDDRNFYILIFVPHFGCWRYTIYSVNELDWNKLDGTDMAKMVAAWHRKRIRQAFFKGSF